MDAVSEFLQWAGSWDMMVKVPSNIILYPYKAMCSLRDLVTVIGDFISIMLGFKKNQEIIISIWSGL